MKQKVCIVHTTPTTVQSLKPMTAAILRGVECYNLMDDSILPEINSCGKITESVQKRVRNLFASAIELRPDAILIACSTIGELVEVAREMTDIPVRRIDEQMCRTAVKAGTRIGVAATLQSTLEPTCRLLEALARETGKEVELRRELVDGVNQLLGEGKCEEYDRILSERLMQLRKQCDVVVLAQASMARALGCIEEDAESYLSSPEAGLKDLACIL